MKRIFVFLACAGTFAFAGCTSDSALPNPTGKGTVRAINAIPDSNEIVFKIEERSLGRIGYKQSSSPATYDDFEYNFNFDTNVPNQDDPRRVITVPQKIDAGREYVLALTGSIENPTVTTWATDLRQWDGTETVFEARFAHLSVSLGDIDVYFDAPANPPSAANLVATLAPGGIMDIRDFAAGQYVITITTAGDPDRVPVYTSGEQTFLEQRSHVISIFDGGANDTAPYILGSMTTSGAFLRLADATYPPSIRFVHGAQTLPTVDVYYDELLTNPVVSGLAPGTATPDFAGSVEAATYYFTPEGSTATTLFSATTSSQLPGSTGDLYLIGATDDWRGLLFTQDRAPVSTSAKISIVNASVNNPVFDLYIKDRGDPLTEEDGPAFVRILLGLSSPALQRVAGSYDIYVTEPGSRNPFAGPYPVDVALGDVVFLLATDDVDPAKIEISDVSIP